MWVLDQPYIPRADRLSAGTPLMLLTVLAAGAAAAVVAIELGALPPRSVIAGILVGAGLSSHLLISASRTLGVQVRVDHVPEVLAAIAYDVGANVLAAECFFRGALFNRAQRRWSFATAATVATAAYV